jgi:hypothetical protein
MKRRWIGFRVRVRVRVRVALVAWKAAQELGNFEAGLVLSL